MADEIRDAEKYLEARLEEFLKRPELHRNTIEVYNSYLKIIRERPQDYAREVGDMFAVMKAEQLDRNESFAALYRKFSQKERVDAYEARINAFRESSGYGDIYLKSNDVQKATEYLLNFEYKRRELLADFFRGIVAWKIAIPADRITLRESVISLWNSLVKLDSELCWEKMKVHPVYRNCLYYNEGQFALLEKWFMEIKV